MMFLPLLTLPSRCWRARAVSLLALLLLAGCAVRAAKPDLDRLYADLAHQPDQPPVIVIHGLMGSTLIDEATGKQYWPGSVGAMAFSSYRDLARLDSGAPDQPKLVPGELFTGIAGVDFYAGLIDSLERIGRFQRGQPGTPVAEDGRRYYVMLYDWRRDNMVAVRQLHALIEQIRHDYGDPRLRVDVIAHSNGGLIANYYVRYGTRDVLGEAQPQPWPEGPKRVRRLVRLGTPLQGSATSLERLLVGMRIALRSVPVEVLATFATPVQALPSPEARAIIDRRGEPVALDLFDPLLWQANHWSVYAPAVVVRVAASAGGAEAGASLVAQLQALFERHLRRAGAWHAALAHPIAGAGVEEAIFGGDCTRTQARAVLETHGNAHQLRFRPNEITDKLPGIDYERLLFEPGDGLVTRQSQVGRHGPGSAAAKPTPTFFLCEDHSRLTVNLYFQNNLLYFLLSP